LLITTPVALDRAAAPVAVVPRKLPATTLPDVPAPLMETPLAFVLPEMTLRSPRVVPPNYVPDARPRRSEDRRGGKKG
jgi:hypothetical protein